ncbi:MAG TPA: hypothetical protein PLS10_14260 [Chitinophagales bacterium]|nr:hypothetical protein [Chitinophagales bacterium]
MAINATNESKPKELIPAGNYIARCYQMIEIGTITEIVMGVERTLKKVRIGWELPTELKVFKEENGEQPLVISKEFTLSMHEKSNLRLALKSWRGKDFTEDEAKKFDITKLIGVPCMLNIIHNPSKNDASKVYEQISGITPLPKGVPCPEQINQNIIISFDDFDLDKFNKLPDFIKDKIKSSKEYKELQNPNHVESSGKIETLSDDDLPF